MTDHAFLAAWPALAGLAAIRPGAVSGTWPLPRCEHGVLGKDPAGPAGFDWLAASPGFSGPTSDLARVLALGGEDVMRRTLLWRADAGLAQAVLCYPAPAPDAEGRAFLEKQVVEWARPGEVPVALGALLLLPLAADLDQARWRDGPRDPFASRDTVRLTPIEVPATDAGALARTVRAGIGELSTRLGEDALGRLYARLLAGERAVGPARPTDPLGPAALAALLLPLPRILADRLTLIGWLPATRPDPRSLARDWDLVLGADGPLPAPSEAAPEPGVAGRGLALARALLAADPGGLRDSVPRPRRAGAAPGAAPTLAVRPSEPSAPVLPATTDLAGGPGVGAAPTRLVPTRIALWGPSGSGKTVFLAQLYWQLSRAQDQDWVVYPGESGLDFLELMRDTLYSDNAFPPGTPPGTRLAILCHLAHRSTGERVTLALEDRAGADYESLHPEVEAGLLAADGIVLLLDPRRADDRVFNEVSHTCERILLAAGAAAGRAAGRDPRPVAVCLTKADELLETADDYAAALADPGAFAAAHIGSRLCDYLETRFARLALFPVSAAGVRMRFGALEPVVFFDESLRPRVDCGEPFNLLAPIDWLIRQVRA